MTEILQFPLKFSNQKIKRKGNSQTMNYQVIKEYINKIWFRLLWLVNTADGIKILICEKKWKSK